MGKVFKLLSRVVLGSALALSIAQPAAAQVSEDLHGCDQQCLKGIGEQYLQAMAAHDPAEAPIAEGTRYTENGVELLMPDGLWRTITKVNDYRLYVADPEFGMLGMFSVMEENGAPILLASRLKIRDRMITEIETTVARVDPSIIPSSGAGTVPHPEALKVLRPQFTQVLPVEARSPRWKLIEIANTYFRALENNNGTDHVPPFADDCHRIENGVATTNNEWNGKGTRSGMYMSCKEGFGLGFYRDDTRLRDMRFMAVDEERGLVFVNGYFDHDAALRSYVANDGQTVTVRRTAPWTWMISEVFQIENGQISQVEAVLLSVPYGMRPLWDNGYKMPSYQEELEKMQN